MLPHHDGFSLVIAAFIQQDRRPTGILKILPLHLHGHTCSRILFARAVVLLKVRWRWCASTNIWPTIYNLMKDWKSEPWLLLDLAVSHKQFGDYPTLPHTMRFLGGQHCCPFWPMGGYHASLNSSEPRDISTVRVQAYTVKNLRTTM